MVSFWPFALVSVCLVAIVFLIWRLERVITRQQQTLYRELNHVWWHIRRSDEEHDRRAKSMLQQAIDRALGLMDTIQVPPVRGGRRSSNEPGAAATSIPAQARTRRSRGGDLGDQLQTEVEGYMRGLALGAAEVGDAPDPDDVT